MPKTNQETKRETQMLTFEYAFALSFNMCFAMLGSETIRNDCENTIQSTFVNDNLNFLVKPS
ncbi:hypothetical protein HanIR_Chr14g0677611 [Helianthus annuus]|nr:hypothetical protein HanIR_Chr14g0677611 [Helianthus annuus]